MTSMNDTNDTLGRLDPNWESVAVGTKVVASDGQTVGTVDAKRSDGLLVKGSDLSEYLVTPPDIANIASDGVHLVVNSRQTMRIQADADAPGGMITDQ